MSEASPIAQERSAGDARESELRLGSPWRSVGWLDREEGGREELSTDDVVARADGLDRRAPLILTGGEPTLRSDLPELLLRLKAAGFVDIVLHTDGAPLGNPAVVRQLVQAGAHRFRIDLHSVRPEAHDFLVGAKGAGRRALKAIAVCRREGVPVEVSCVVTRPVTTHLAETVAAVCELGVRRIILRRLRNRGAAAERYVSLAARFGLLARQVEDAVALAERRRSAVVLVDFPPCAFARVAEHCEASGEADAHSQDGCPPCRWRDVCPGAPLDYVTQFGWLDIRGDESAANERAQGAPRGDAPFVVPPARQGRRSVTNPIQVASRGGRPLGGDPLLGVAQHPFTPVQRIHFAAPARVQGCDQCADAGESVADPETSREIRIRIVGASQEGIERLRIASAGSLAHPRAVEMIRFAQEMGIDTIEVAAEGSILAELSEEAIDTLAGLDRLDVPLFGPDAARHDAHIDAPGSFDAALEGVARLATRSGARAGCYAVIHDAAEVADFVTAWERGELPGTPTFRLSPRGGDLRELAEIHAGLGGAARDALAPLLPRCLCAEPPPAPAHELPGPAWRFGRYAGVSVSGCDRLGEFAPCRCDREDRALCRGIAIGWRFEA